MSYETPPSSSVLSVLPGQFSLGQVVPDAIQPPPLWSSSPSFPRHLHRHHSLAYVFVFITKCNVGCTLNGHLINHIMYTDDLVLISPSSAGLSQLLNECEQFGTRYDVKYNAKKSEVMIYRSMTLKGCIIPNFKLNGIISHVVASVERRPRQMLKRHDMAEESTRQGNLETAC